MTNIGSDIPSPDHHCPFESQLEELPKGLEEEECWDVDHESSMDFDVFSSRSLPPASWVRAGDTTAMVDSPRDEQEISESWGFTYSTGIVSSS